jgi:hypothetical protein
MAGESLDKLGPDGLIILDDQDPGICHAPDSRPTARARSKDLFALAGQPGVLSGKLKAQGIA